MARRAAERLTHLEVKNIKEPGYHADGKGLYLVVDKTLAKRWAFIFQFDGKRKEMGLGSTETLGVKEARELVVEHRKAVEAGRNPIEERKIAKALEAAPAHEVVTFGVWATEISPVIGPKAVKAQKAWLGSVTTKMPKLQNMAPAAIETSHVLEALKPYWTSRQETGSRMRARLENILDAAKAKGMITDPAWQNPARWKGHLQHLLSKQTNPVKHHAALPYERFPAFMTDLRALEDRMAAQALEFTVLTVARTKETLGATWREIDWKEKVWTVPAARMKGVNPREHRVPLTPAALAVLEKVKPINPAKLTDLIFNSPRFPGRKMSENTMQKVLNDMDLAGIATVHGFRSTFKDWAEDCTNFANGVIEAALSHLVGDETERAYRRGDALLKRRKLMEAWEGYAAGGRGKVIPLSSVRR